MTDKKQILDNLMEHGKTTGKLTTKEITDALEKLDYDVEQMDSFYDSCAANNIEIIDDRTLKKQEKDWQKQTSDLLFLSQKNMWAEE